MTDEFDGVPPNKFAPEPVESEIGSTPEREYAPFYFPPEGATLSFTFTEEIFVKIASALRNGCMMTYGEEGPAVYWEFIKQVDYPQEVEVSCEDVANCIEADEDTQDAVFDLLGDDLGAGTESRLGHDIGNYLVSDEDFLSSLGVAITPWLVPTEGLGPDGASDDAFWATCVGVARYTNTVITDFLEVMELHTDKAEFVTKFLDSVPVLGALLNAVGATQWADDFDWIQEVLVEQYDAGWTETEGGTMYQFSCLLYCNCIGDKVISFDRIIEASEQLASQYIPIDFQNAVTLMSSLLGLSGEGAPIVWGAFAFTWGLARFMSLVGLQRISNSVLKVVLKTASTQSEGSFEDHCDSCEEISCFDFKVSDFDWTTYDDTGAQYVPFVGFGQNLNTTLAILAPLGNDIVVTKITVTFSRAWVGANDYDKFYAIISNSDGSNAQTFNGGSLLFGGRVFNFESTIDTWVRPRVFITAGGGTFPPNGFNATAQYVEKICFNL